MKIAFVGQAMPKTDPDRPFGRTKLYTWFEDAGISKTLIERHFVFTALVDYFPGYKGKSHRIPTEEEIVRELPRLKKFLFDSKVKAIVSVGRLSSEYALGCKIVDFNKVVGRKFEVDAYKVFGNTISVIPLAHPSGASAWYYKKGNMELIMKAMELIKKEVADVS